MFSKIAILNRGEPAVRFIRAMKEYNLEHDLQLQALALYTESDRYSPFTRQADIAISIGDAMRDLSDGSKISAYCDHEFILSILEEHQCDAVWPGWGFVSEDPTFVAKLEERNIVFLGPSSEAMFQLGDKIAAKYLAQASGVPLTPWAECGEDDSENTLLAHGIRIGYPLMVKASAGGGGRGIIKVNQESELLPAIGQVREQVAKVFGQGGILLEKCISGARHIEVQFVVNQNQEAFALGIRDCSIQRKNQKVIEEAPSPILPKDIEDVLCESAKNLALRSGYVGVGTAEFLYDPKTKVTTFLEVNSRLQVEHTITELIYGCDLVKAQIDIARNIPWSPPNLIPRGHAIELRVNAENPERDFQPAPGKIAIFRTPSGPGIRVDSGVVEGMEIAPYFDSMIAKIIAYAPTRKQAIARVLRACRELEAVVVDGSTNQAFLCELLQNPMFVEATADTAWLDRFMATGDGVSIWFEPEALVTAAILAYERKRFEIQEKFFVQSQDGIPQQIATPEGIDVDLRLRNKKWSMHVVKRSADLYSVGTENNMHLVYLHEISTGIAQLQMRNTQHKVLYAIGNSGISVEVDGYTHHVERATGGKILAPSPAVVVSIDVAIGEEVVIGQKLITLEAMKMEMPVLASEAGTVTSIHCLPNQQVAVGDILLSLSSQNVTDTTESESSFPKSNQAPIPLYPKDVLKEESLILQDVIFTVLKGYACEEVIFNEICTLLEQSFDDVTDFSLWTWIFDALEAFSDIGIVMDRNILLETNGELSMPADLAFFEFCRRSTDGEEGAITALRPLILRALHFYNLDSLESSERLRQALMRIAMANTHAHMRHQLCSLLLRAMIELHELGMSIPNRVQDILDRVVLACRDPYPFVRDYAVQADYILFNRAKYALQVRTAKEMLKSVIGHVVRLDPEHRSTRASMNRIANHPHALQLALLEISDIEKPDRWRVLEGLVRRMYAGRPCVWKQDLHIQLGAANIFEVIEEKSGQQSLLAVMLETKTLQALCERKDDLPKYQIMEIVWSDPISETKQAIPHIEKIVQEWNALSTKPQRITFTWRSPLYGERHRTYVNKNDILVEQELLRNIHPEAARRVELWRLRNFHLTRLAAHDRVYAFLGQAMSNPKDERIFICGEIFGEITDDVEPFWSLEQVFFEAIKVLREVQSKRTHRTRLRFNWMHFYIHNPISVDNSVLKDLAFRLEPYTRDLELQEVNIRAKRAPTQKYAPPKNIEIIIRKPGSYRLGLEIRDPSTLPLEEMTTYDMKVVRAKRSGYAYPYEIIKMITGGQDITDVQDAKSYTSDGTFQEYDLNEHGNLEPVYRNYGENICGVVIGVITNITKKYPNGISRVWIGSDSTSAMGALAEPECLRIIKALDMARKLRLPVEWLPISSGAKIAMSSGTENLDWTAQVLRHIIQFTQDGFFINIIVHGINVGAQSYWNAEATMLMHTKGILIMTLEGSMVLTGKKALDFSGSVSAEDERGIGGAERIMGPNGQAQVICNNLSEAYATLFDWYSYTYIDPNESSVRKLQSSDSKDRSILNMPYTDLDGTFTCIGDIFDDRINSGRKKPFAIRQVMNAVIDQDSEFLERYVGLKDGESAVTWESHIGGHSVSLIGFESRPLTRRGRIPMDGPDIWTGGTLFPNSSKKVARAINSASGNRPVVVLANLSGFDGSPESLRRLQLQLGAEIGRAVVNFVGKFIFVVIGRYHGGAYVVFSKALNKNIVAMAIEGSFASVIGGAPAAAVVFPREVNKRVKEDTRILELQKEISKANSEVSVKLRQEFNTLYQEVMLEKRGEVAMEFDQIHSVQRAVEVGSLDRVIQAQNLRKSIIEELDGANDTTTSTYIDAQVDSHVDLQADEQADSQKTSPQDTETSQKCL